MAILLWLSIGLNVGHTQGFDCMKVLVTRPQVASALLAPYHSLTLPKSLTPVTEQNPLTYDLFLKLQAQAQALALSAHGDQKYGGLPYKYHLEAVERALIEVGFDPRHSLAAREVLLGAWLHDTIEDTAVTRELLTIIFGASVAHLVEAVTAIPSDMGLDKGLAELQNILKVRNHPLGPTLKAADRWANVAHGLAHGNLKVKYARTYLVFRRELGPDNPLRALSEQELLLWTRLDRALFSY